MWNLTTKNKKKETIFVAVFDYEARTDDDLVLRAGDELIILDDIEFDWWKAKNKKSRKQKFIPSNFVVKLESLE